MNKRFLFAIISCTILVKTQLPLPGSQCQNNRCYITVVTESVANITCNSAYENCFIRCVDKGCMAATIATSAKHLHCPKEQCTQCAINICSTAQCKAACSPGRCSVQGLIIHGYGCTVLEINVPNGIFFSVEDNIIFAPANDGELVVKEFAEFKPLGFQHNEVYSVPGTKNMIFDSAHYNNYIDGTYVSGYLNFSCVNNCNRTEIICGESTKCNINCTSHVSAGGCLDMNVYKMTGDDNDFNWHCGSEYLTVCYGARITCDESASSAWFYDSVAGWFLNSDECWKRSEEFSLPPLSCTSTTSDTCIIIRDESYYSQSRDLQCNAQYANCQMFIEGIGSGNEDIHPVQFHCPNPSNNDCDSCRIVCSKEFACSNATIMGYNCSVVEIRIVSAEQSGLDILAPGHNGELIIITDYAGMTNVRPEFYNSNISSVEGTKNMILDFVRCEKCGNNLIDGRSVMQFMNVSCVDTSVCENNKIWCPNDAECNIYCISLMEACGNTQVHAIEGTNDVNWICVGRHHSVCQHSFLECSNGISYWYDKIENLEDEFEYSREWIINGSCVDPPSESPTAAPSTSPTSAPTKSPLYLFERFGFQNEYEWHLTWSFATLLILFFLFAGLWSIYYYKRLKPIKIRKSKIKEIQNALVLVIAIGDYSNEDIIQTDIDIDGYLSDLHGIHHDIENMTDLFGDKLNFDVFSANKKTEWTEKELADFLVEKAEYLEENIDNKQGKMYDGLIVIVSCHGMPYYLCTSDYKKYSKLAFHRQFSLNHPKSRTIPRFFLYDCCSGNDQREWLEYDSDSVTDDNKETGKNIEEQHIVAGTTTQLRWIVGDNNPDYLLGKVEAANQGFQSKLDSENGSYVIHKFYDKYIENLKETDIIQRQFIHEIFDEIQIELHDAGKQHPEYVWNDNTRYIVFKKKEENNVEIETIKEKEEVKEEE